MQRQGRQRDAVAIWKQWPLRPSVSIGRTRWPPRSEDFSPRSKYFYCIWHLHQVLNIQTWPTISSLPPAIAVAPTRKDTEALRLDRGKDGTGSLGSHGICNDN